MICTLLHSRGDLPDDVYEADCRFGASVSREAMAGYHAWAIPVIRGMRRSPWFYRFAGYFAKSWAYEMAHRMGVRPKGNLLGRFMLFIGVPLCTAIGKSHGLEAQCRSA